MTDIPLQQVPAAIYFNVVATSVGIFSIVIPRLSVAILLVRLFEPRRQISAGLIFLALLGVIFAVITVIIIFVQCSPVPGQWNQDKYHPTCWSPFVLINESIFAGCEYLHEDCSLPFLT